MTTNLVIAYVDIPHQAVRIWETYSSSDTAATYNSDLGYYNTIAGERHTYWVTQTTSNIYCVAYGLNSGVTVTPDYCLISGKISETPTNYKLVVQSSSDGVTWADESSTGAFSGETFYGVESDDLIEEFTASGAKRYWRAKFEKVSGSNAAFYLSKIYLGNLFDFSLEPDAYSIDRVPARFSNYYAASGSNHFVDLKREVYIIKIEWNGVSDDKVKDFYNKVVKFKHIYPVYLVTRSDHVYLDNQRILNCRLETCYTEQSATKADYNKVVCTFRQII